MADLVDPAVDGTEHRAPFNEMDQLGAQLFQFADALATSSSFILEQPIHMFTRCGPVGADLDDTVDFGKCRSRGLGPLDEPACKPSGSRLCDMLPGSCAIFVTSCGV